MLHTQRVVSEADPKARFGEKFVSVFGLEMILPSKVSEATLAGLKNCAKK